MPARLLLLLLLTAFSVQADGIYKNRGVLKPAEIPGQTAALSHRDGQETLTIWNTVNAGAEELAWVLPLPAPPDIIQETHPAALQMLQTMCAPPVRTGKPQRLYVACIVILLVMGAGLLLLKRRQAGRHGWIAALFHLALAISILFLVMPGFVSVFGASANSPPVAGVRVLDTREAGNYETTVIAGDSAKAVNDWLTAGGFPAFDGAELRVAEDYIAKQWVFLCAKLKTGAAGPLSTHPLTVRFPVAAPVYPMRLTAGAGTVPVDLYVIGDEWAADSRQRMRREMTIRIDTDAGRLRSWTGDADRLLATLAGARAITDPNLQRQHLQMNSIPFVPEGRDALLDSVMHSSCVTRLNATFTPASDWSDITFEWTRERASPRRHMTRGAFAAELLAIRVNAAAGMFAALGLLARILTPRGRRPHRAWPLGALVVLAGIPLLAGINMARSTVIVESGDVVRPGEDDQKSAESLARQWLKSLALPK